MASAFAIKNIWLAEDDKDDCDIFTDVVQQLLPLANVTVFHNGEAVLNQLTAANKPDMLFLDINMPIKDGIECLLEIRAIRDFSRLPIVIFSSSKAPQFIDKAYGYGANLYYTKPASFTQMIEGMGKLLQMDWSDPFTITNGHYINNRFIPFSSNTPAI